jgi:crossover junction endodeoxyribonuclease RusA
VALYAPDKRARDLDNALKATLDALQKAGCFESDAQIDDLRIVRAGVDKPLGHLEVEVQPLHATP